MASYCSNSNISVGRDDHKSKCSNDDQIASGCSNSNISVSRDDHESKCSDADQIASNCHNSNISADEVPTVPCVNPLAAMVPNADPEMMEDKEVLLNSHENNAHAVDEHEGRSPYEFIVPELDEQIESKTYIDDDIFLAEARSSETIDDKMIEENDLNVFASSLAFQQQQNKEYKDAEAPSTEKQNLILGSQMLIFDSSVEFSLH
ncbi:hypothetical protein Nepgr_026523 [Nepenthes gracilis]|uniref:Uncharacterized protein n=1 Tax=Nepenthes gracilis TaxID=150966 RepID=A0AAD3T716_NEPGR|nr:hypothetical protein Nepgr_026523 [Nepenthes gracilis]